MFAASIARIVEHRRRRRCAAERLVVGDIDPTSGDIGLAGGQDRDGCVVAVEPLARENMALDRVQDGLEDQAAGAYGVGHGR